MSSSKTSLLPAYTDKSPRRPSQSAQNLWRRLRSQAFLTCTVFTLINIAFLSPALPPLSQQCAAVTGILPKAISQFASRPPSHTKSPKIRMLHLIDKPTSESLMDRWFLRSHGAFQAATDLVEEAVMWGPGFPKYENSSSLKQNIKNVYGDARYFDAVLTYFNNDQEIFLKANSTHRFLEWAELSREGVVMIDRPHEMRDERRRFFYEHSNVSLVLAPYPNELYDYQKFGKHALLVHQPHFIDDSFIHDPEKTRSNDALLAGGLNLDFYPLRHRLNELIRDKKITGRVRAHPGYPDTFTEAERAQRGINNDSLAHQAQDFANELGDSKICFVTGSRWQYSVQKYGEAAAAGCMMMGTVPSDRQNVLRDLIVPLKQNDPELHIRDTINHWLHVDPKGRIKRAKAAQKYFVENFSSRKYAEDVVRWIGQFRNGQRGLVLPYEWKALPVPLPFDG